MPVIVAIQRSWKIADFATFSHRNLFSENALRRQGTRIIIVT